MLERLIVRTFKSLDNVAVDLGLVDVFIGANGSGKSNLLEALGVLSAAADGKVDDQALLARGVRPGLPALYKSAFPARPGKKIPSHLYLVQAVQKPLNTKSTYTTPSGIQNLHGDSKQSDGKMGSTDSSNAGQPNARPILNEVWLR